MAAAGAPAEWRLQVGACANLQSSGAKQTMGADCAIELLTLLLICWPHLLVFVFSHFPLWKFATNQILKFAGVFVFYFCFRFLDSLEKCDNLTRSSA